MRSKLVMQWVVVLLLFLGFTVSGHAGVTVTLDPLGSSWTTGIVVDSFYELQDVYVSDVLSFSVADDEYIPGDYYTVTVSVDPEPSTWSKALMDPSNVAMHTQDYEKAFDIFLKGPDNQWSNLGHSGSVQENSPLPHLYDLRLVLVLVDQENSVMGEDTAGEPGKRRFAELPSGHYETDVVVTVAQGYNP